MDERHGWQTVVRQDLSVIEILWDHGRPVDLIERRPGSVPAYCHRCQLEHKGVCTQ